MAVIQVTCSYCCGQGGTTVPHFSQDGEWQGDEFQPCREYSGDGWNYGTDDGEAEG